MILGSDRIYDDDYGNDKGATSLEPGMGALLENALNVQKYKVDVLAI